MNIKNVVVAGSGVLGTQIAFQTAFKGFQVTIYNASDKALDAGREKVEYLKGRYTEDIRAAQAQGEQSFARLRLSKTVLTDNGDPFENLIESQLKLAEAVPGALKYSTDLAKALQDADLLIEAIPESVEIKKTFYTEVARVAPEKTIFVSNTSTLLPSTFAEYTGRPEKFLCLHFANEIWRNNTAEVMGHETTDPQVYQQVVEFAEAIGMVALQLKKEQPRYLLNSLLIPFLEAGQTLLLNEVADVETIDLAWRRGTGAPAGPFQILDVVGITTAYNIIMAYPDAADETSAHARLGKLLKEKYLDKGKTGVASGEGFYKYK